MKYYRYKNGDTNAIIVDLGCGFRYKYLESPNRRFSGEWRHSNSNLTKCYTGGVLTELTEDEFFLECI